MADHIDITAAAGAPMLLAGRRGTSPRLALAAISVPARIPVASPDEFSDRRKIASYEFAVRNGRLWRPVEGFKPDWPKSAKEAPAPMDMALAALAGAGDKDVRRHFGPAILDPAYVRNQYGQLGPWKVVVGEEGAGPGDHPLDLRAEAAAAIAGRLARGVAFDGSHLWIAVRPPELVAGAKPTFRYRTVQSPGHQDMEFPCPPEAADLHAAFMARNRFKDRSPATYPKRLAREASYLLELLDGVEHDPLDHVDLFVRRHAPVVYQAIGGPFSFGDHREAMRDLQAGLLPLVARASAGLVPRDGLGDAVDRMAAAAAAALATARSWDDGLGVTGMRHVIQYVEEVARPLLARRPVEAADMEALGELGGPARR